MPFKSEAQRRYLWANEPEIARDWTDTYGSRIQKSNGGITQAGVINYLPSKEVTVPVEAKSSPDHVKAHLAYITDAEQDLLIKKNLHGSLKGKPNRGPGGIPSLQGDFGGGWDKYEGGQSGTGTSGSHQGGGNPWADAWSGGDIQTTSPYKDPDPANEVVPGDIKYTGDNPWATAWDDGPEFKKDWGPDPETEKKKIEKWESEQDWSKTKKSSGDGWQISSLWSPQTHYDLSLNLPGAKKNRRANIKAYKEYLEAQGVDSSWLDPEDLSYAQWQEMKQFKPQGLTDKDALLQALQNTAYTNMPVTAIPQTYKEFMLTQKGSPGMYVSGDVGNFWNKPKPKDLVNPYTGSYYTNAEWDALKKEIIEDRGYPTGNENYGGVPGAVPFGDMPLWQQQGFKSYEDWLAAQGGGATLPGFDVDSPKNTVAAKTAFPYASYGTAGYPTSSTFQSYLARGGRVPAAFGGIMDTRTGRRAYGLGSIFKGVKKAIGKVLGSDIGKAALGIGAGYWLGGGFTPGGFKWSNIAGSLGGWGSGAKRFGETGLLGKGLLKDASLGWDAKKNLSLGKLLLTSAALPFIPGINKAPENENIGMADRGGGLIDPITGKEAKPAEMRASLNDALSAAWNEDKQAYESEAMAAIKKAYPFLGQYPIYKVKDGGRIGAQEGGLMDLGGMEKDYRNNGGFVAIGGEERADDVPARLSRNEFVFTADAVRGAGGGDIDKGAEIMENVMKNLEQGGKISQETQGNTGAQEMFSVSERIGEVL